MSLLKVQLLVNGNGVVDGTPRETDVPNQMDEKILSSVDLSWSYRDAFVIRHSSFAMAGLEAGSHC
jgi:hypothetical protein